MFTCDPLFNAVVTVADLENWLRERLRPPDHEVVLVQQLYTAKQQHGESILSFAPRLFTLIQRINPNATPAEMRPYLWAHMDKNLAMRSEAHREETDVSKLILKLSRVEQLSGVDVTYLGCNVFNLNADYKVMLRDTTWKREANTPFPGRTAAADLEADSALTPVLHTKV